MVARRRTALRINKIRMRANSLGYGSQERWQWCRCGRRFKDSSCGSLTYEGGWTSAAAGGAGRLSGFSGEAFIAI